MNVPNALSLTRICMVPFFIAAFLLPMQWGVFVAIAIFLLATFTDFLDGFIARKYHLVTDLGKLLDPIADKILVCAALFCIVAVNPYQYFGDSFFSLSSSAEFTTLFGTIFLTVSGIVIISREFLVSAIRMIAASKGIVVQANNLGKVKTVFQDVSLLFIMVLYAQKYNAQSHIVYDIFGFIGNILLGIAVLFTVISGVKYLIQNRKVFLEKHD